MRRPPHAPRTRLAAARRARREAGTGLAGICNHRAARTHAPTRAPTHEVCAEGSKRADAKQREHAIEANEHLVEQRVQRHGGQHVDDDVRKPREGHGGAAHAEEAEEEEAQLVHHPAHLAVLTLGAWWGGEWEGGPRS